MRESLYETTRTILLAGIGAISLAQDEINYFVDRMVERGQMAEADARRLVQEMKERRESLEKERRMQVEARRAKAASSQPVTRAEVDALNARIAELTRQIEDLRTQKSGQP